MQQKPLIAGRIPGVNLTRTIGALGILIFHFGCHCGWLTPYLCNTASYNFGAVWVAVFLITSGACLARSYSGEWQIGTFYKKRWLSIFPLYFTAWGALGVLRLLVAGRWWDGIPKLNILLTLIGVDGYFCAQIPTFYLCGEWFIGALIVCYLAFPILRWLLQRIPLITAILLIAGTCFIPFLSCFDRDPFNNLWTCVTIFYIGMLVVQYPRMTSHWATAIVSAIFVLVASFIPLHLGGAAYICMEILVGLAFYLLLNYIGAFMERPRRLSAVLSHSSGLSFTFFLLHHQIIYIMLVRFPIDSIGRAVAVLGYTIVLTAVLAEALLTNYKVLCEKMSHFFIKMKNN